MTAIADHHAAILGALRSRLDSLVSEVSCTAEDILAAERGLPSPERDIRVEALGLLHDDLREQASEVRLAIIAVRRERP
jgi:hypothetical protein